MPNIRWGLAVLLLVLLSAPGSAAGIDALQGKFAFNWHSNPGGQKCVKVGGKLLDDFKSSKYRCDLKPQSNTSSGATVRTCTAVKGGKEYLIFDTQRACNEERETQASNE